MILIISYLIIFISSFSLVNRSLTSLKFSEKILASLIMFYAFIVSSMLGLGIVGKLYLPWFLALIGVYFVSGLLAWKPITIPPIHLSKTSKLLLVVWFVIQGYCLAFIYEFPPFTNDGLGYHLPNVAKWYQAHRIYQIATPNWASNTLPMNQELIALSTVVLTRNDVMVELGHFLFVPLVMVALYCLSRFLGAKTDTALIAGIGFTTVPAMFLQSITNMSDYAMVALALTSLYWALRWLRTPQLSSSLILGISLGLLVGVKTQGLHFSIALLFMILIFSYKMKHGFSRIIMLGITCFICIGLLGSFWYVKNYHFFHNPFFPFEVTILGFTFHNPPGSFPLKGYGLSMDNFVQNGTAFISQMFNLFPYYQPDLAYINGWGWWFLIPGVPLVALATLYNHRFRRVALPIVLYFLMIVGSIIYQPGNARYVILFSVLPYLAFASLPPRSILKTSFSQVIQLTILVQMVVTLLLCFRFGILDRFRVASVLSTPLLQRSAYLMMPSWYDKVGQIASLPLSEPVGFFGEQNELNYMLYEPTLTRKIVYIEPTNLSAIIRQMNQNQIEYIVAQPTPLYAPLIREMENSGLFTRPFPGSYFFRHVEKAK